MTGQGLSALLKPVLTLQKPALTSPKPVLTLLLTMTSLALGWREKGKKKIKVTWAWLCDVSNVQTEDTGRGCERLTTLNDCNDFNKHRPPQRSQACTCTWLHRILCVLVASLYSSPHYPLSCRFEGSSSSLATACYRPLIARLTRSIRILQVLVVKRRCYALLLWENFRKNTYVPLGLLPFFFSFSLTSATKFAKFTVLPNLIFDHLI